MVFNKCKNCGKEREIHGGGFCNTCYKKLMWRPKSKICKRCQRLLPMHAKGLCAGCYQFVFHLENNKAWNHKKNYGLNITDYKKITEKCIICGFDKVVDLHHLDENHENNSKENLIGICPNHHKMIHDFRYRKEMRELLKQNGYNLPTDKKLDFVTTK